MTGTEGEPTGAQPGGEVPSAEDAAAASHPKGSMRFQDASTAAREPTVGEIRAREKAQEKAESDRAAQEVAEVEAAATKRKRKRLLIGGVAAVGVVGVVAALYSSTGSHNDVSARCVDTSGTVVSDNYCGGGSNYGSGGIFFFGGGSYRYNYGGSGGIGQRISGGSTTAPKGSSISGGSGSTSSKSSVSRGGLGAGSSHSSSGSSSGS